MAGIENMDAVRERNQASYSHAWIPDLSLDARRGAG